MENFEMIKNNTPESQKEEEEDKQGVIYEKRPCFIQQVPEEIIMEVFKWTDVKTFLNIAPYVCKEWNGIIFGQKNKKQAGKLFKQHCMNIWRDSGLYQATSKYLESFGNFRNMLKMRPLIRFDGFYICKMMYRRQGLNVNSLNYPVHEVVWYRYIRFLPDRSAISLYTNSTPKRFLPKYTQ